MTQAGWWQSVVAGSLEHKMQTLAEEGIDLEADGDSTITVLRFWERFDGLKILENNLLRLTPPESIVRARRKYLEHTRPNGTP